MTQPVFRRTVPNGILHLYGGNWITTDKTVWDPITSATSSFTVRKLLAP